jgi:2-dehydro-3-deoxygluconokinase
MLSGVEWLHISGITPAVSELAGTEALEAAAAATAAGVKVSFDGNYRAKLWQARGETGAPFLRKLLDHATLAFIDERDIALVLGGSVLPRLEAAGAAFGAFPRLQMLAATTRDASGVESHALGATLHTRAGETRIDPIALPHIVDRIGGGDAFAGGLLFALMDGMEGADALAFALYSAAAKHGQSGDASHASATDIRALMDGKLDVKR